MLIDREVADIDIVRRGSPRLRYRCGTCSKLHNGLPELNFASPDAWGLVAEETRGVKSHLNKAFCVIEDHDYFVRCALEVPIVGGRGDLPEVFTFSVWSSLSLKSFNTLRMHEQTENNSPRVGPFFGWFSNRLATYPDTTNLRCSVEPRPGAGSPVLRVEAGDHPLSVDCRKGMSADRAIEIARTIPGLMVVIG